MSISEAQTLIVEALNKKIEKGHKPMVYLKDIYGRRKFISPRLFAASKYLERAGVLRTGYRGGWNYVEVDETKKKIDLGEALPNEHP
jgi:hypothetical protein